MNFPCSADHEQDWQPYPVDLYSCYICDHTYIRTYIHTYVYSLSNLKCFWLEAEAIIGNQCMSCRWFEMIVEGQGTTNTDQVLSHTHTVVGGRGGRKNHIYIYIYIHTYIYMYIYI